MLDTASFVMDGAVPLAKGLRRSSADQSSTRAAGLEPWRLSMRRRDVSSNPRLQKPVFPQLDWDLVDWYWGPGSVDFVAIPRRWAERAARAPEGTQTGNPRLEEGDQDERKPSAGTDVESTTVQATPPVSNKQTRNHRSGGGSGAGTGAAPIGESTTARGGIQPYCQGSENRHRIYHSISLNRILKLIVSLLP